MGKTNFQYDESGNTFYYFLLTFLSFILFPSTYYFWPQEEKVPLNFFMPNLSKFILLLLYGSYFEG